MDRKRKLLWGGVLIFVVLILVFTLVKQFIHYYPEENEFEILPRCDMDGGQYKKCAICGREQLIAVTEELGHKSAWVTLKEPTAATSGERELRCTVCSERLDLIKIPAKLSPIPALRLTGRGAGMTNTTSIAASFIYTDGAETEEAQSPQTEGSLKVRLMNGGEPAAYKHSYVIDGFDTAGQKLFFGDFGDSKKLEQIELYANNDDPTCARRIIAYRQWKDLVSENYPEYADFISVSDELEYAGYNLLLYIKSTKSDYSFAGIYTLSVPYSTLADINKEADILYVVKHTVTAADREGVYSYIYGDPAEQSMAIESLNNMLSGGYHGANFDRVYDVVLDYYCFSTLIGNREAFSEIYWVTSDGLSWYPVPSNTEHTYGSTKGTVGLTAHDVDVDTKSGFWLGFETEYAANIHRRMNELAQGRLSPDNIRREFENAVSKLDDDVYMEDSDTYGNTYHDPHAEIENLILWYEKRLASKNVSVSK